MDVDAAKEAIMSATIAILEINESVGNNLPRGYYKEDSGSNATSTVSNIGTNTSNVNSIARNNTSNNGSNSGSISAFESNRGIGAVPPGYTNFASSFPNNTNITPQVRESAGNTSAVTPLNFPRPQNLPPLKPINGPLPTPPRLSPSGSSLGEPDNINRQNTNLQRIQVNQNGGRRAATKKHAPRRRRSTRRA